MLLKPWFFYSLYPGAQNVYLSSAQYFVGVAVGPLTALFLTDVHILVASGPCGREQHVH